MSHLTTRVEQVQQAFENAEAVIIGAGAGLSAAGGLTYSGERFEQHFADYIRKYQMSDMYSAGFYPFPSQQTKWAYWSKHIQLNRHQPEALEVYCALRELIGDKKHFIITTNVDGQLAKAGFKEENIFAVQGDYGLLQCATPCHDQLYDNAQQVAALVDNQHDCMVDSALIPTCPKCGGNMDPHIRINSRFVENDAWKRQSQSYAQFVQDNIRKPILLLELGVGYNTPSIIKYPFEQITAQASQATLARLNRDHPEFSEINKDRTVVFAENMLEIFAHLDT